MKLRFLVSALFLTCAIQTHAEILVRLQQTTLNPSKKSEVEAFTYQDQQNLWIVSFLAPISETIKKDVQDKGYEILSFIPDQALLIRGPKRDVIFESQQAWYAFNPAWKWSKELQAPSIMNESARVLHVRLFTSQDRIKFLKKLDNLKRAFLLHQSENHFVIRSYDSEFFQISQMEEVAYLQPLPEFEVLQFDLSPVESSSSGANVSGFETGTRAMNFESAWEAGFKGQGQIVAMGDTGLDTGSVQSIHSDFQGAIIKGQNFAPFGKSWEDPMGHGTHVAGSIVGRGTQSQGLFKGGAFESQLIVHSLWSPLLGNLMIPTRLSEMFSAASGAGARVHTNSWGSARNFGAYDSFARQVDEYSFNNPDFLIIFAAGNSGVDKNKDGRIDADSIASPATAKNALSVGASENLELTGGIQKTVSELRDAKDIWGAEPIWSSRISDNLKGLAMFSSRGPTDDGRIKPDIVAPGTNILSTRSRHKKAQPLWGYYDDDYVWSGGTSMAAPLVAGAAAVTREVLQKDHRIQNPSASLIKATLMNTATDLFPGQYGLGGAVRGQEILTARPNSDEGFGLVNMKSIVNAESFISLQDNRMGLATGETETVEFELKKETKLFITLVWNDAPAAEVAGRALVNNLDLEVQGPDLHFQSLDAINNFEHFEKTAKPGRYFVKVLGRQIPNGLKGRQGYSLVIRSESLN